MLKFEFVTILGSIEFIVRMLSLSMVKGERVKIKLLCYES